MSQVSTWLGPPQSSTKMQDLSEATALPEASTCIAPHHHSRHAETQRPQAARDEGLPPVHLEIVHESSRVQVEVAGENVTLGATHESAITDATLPCKGSVVNAGQPR